MAVTRKITKTIWDNIWGLNDPKSSYYSGPDRTFVDKMWNNYQNTDSMVPWFESRYAGSLPVQAAAPDSTVKDKQTFVNALMEIPSSQRNLPGASGTYDQIYDAYKNNPSLTQQYNALINPKPQNTQTELRNQSVINFKPGTSSLVNGATIDNAGYKLVDKLFDQYRQGVDITQDSDFSSADPAVQKYALQVMSDAYQDPKAFYKLSTRPSYQRYQSGGTDALQNYVPPEVIARGQAAVDQYNQTHPASTANTPNMTKAEWDAMGTMGQERYKEKYPAPTFDDAGNTVSTPTSSSSASGVRLTGKKNSDGTPTWFASDDTIYNTQAAALAHDTKMGVVQPQPASGSGGSLPAGGVNSPQNGETIVQENGKNVWYKSDGTRWTDNNGSWVQDTNYKSSGGSGAGGGTAGTGSSGGTTIGTDTTTTSTGIPDDVKNSAYYQQLDPEMQSLLGYYWGILTGGSSQKMEAFKTALDLAKQQADPYWQEKINIVSDELNRTISGNNQDLASTEKTLMQRKQQIEDNLTYNRNSITTEQAAELARQKDALDQQLLGTREQMANRGLTSSSIRNRSEDILNKTSSDVVQSYNRNVANQLHTLETGSAFDIQDIQDQVGNLVRKTKESNVDATRSTEKYLGTDLTKNVSGAGDLTLGGLSGSMLEDKTGDILTRAKGLLSAS